MKIKNESSVWALISTCRGLVGVLMKRLEAKHKGWPDVWYTLGGVPGWIELKHCEDSRLCSRLSLSPEQVLFQKAMADAGVHRSFVLVWFDGMFSASGGVLCLIPSTETAKLLDIAGRSWEEWEARAVWVLKVTDAAKADMPEPAAKSFLQKISV